MEKMNNYLNNNLSALLMFLELLILTSTRLMVCSIVAHCKWCIAYNTKKKFIIISFFTFNNLCYTSKSDHISFIISNVTSNIQGDSYSRSCKTRKTIHRYKKLVITCYFDVKI